MEFIFVSSCIIGMGILIAIFMKTNAGKRFFAENE